MPIDRFACARQLLTQQDFAERGVRFYANDSKVPLAVMSEPLSGDEQTQLIALLDTIEILVCAGLNSALATKEKTGAHHA